MSGETICALCGCVLTLGNMEFAGHTPDLCRHGTASRLAHLRQMLDERDRDIALLRDMIARHDCAARVRAAERAEKEKANGE